MWLVIIYKLPHPVIIIKWTMKTCNRTRTSDGRPAHDGILSKLYKTYENISKLEARTWLFENLQRQNLTTRDIYYFALKQAQLRTENKEPDQQTIKFAMKAKQHDIRVSLSKLMVARKDLENNLLSELLGRKFKLRKIMKNVKLHGREIKEQKINSYKIKIKHYSTKQINSGGGPEIPAAKYANTASSLQAYGSLSIFRGPTAMPPPEPPLGPFICDPAITLTEEERLILSKTPKFSVRGEVHVNSMLIEAERMLTKHRLTRNSAFREKDNSTEPNTTSPEVIFRETGDRITTLSRLWRENKHRLIYNEIEGVMCFDQRRPTDYRNNKFIKLPKPLGYDEEFLCEVRRRKIMNTFKKYKTIYEEEAARKKMTPLKKGNHNYTKSQCSQESNLTKKELRGLKSLKKRIKDGEIIISQSDKSSRLCVLSREQYIKSGETHTMNDDEIDWQHVKSLQNKVNSVVWWLSKIINHSRNTGEKRMMDNNQDHNGEIAEMYLLLKDHKTWTPESDTSVPSRPVVSGNKTYNVHLSELLSELLEPIAKEMSGGEISSTEDALHKLETLNEHLLSGGNLETFDGLDLCNKKYEFRRKTIDTVSDNYSEQRQLDQSKESSSNFNSNAQNLCVSDQEADTITALLESLLGENGQPEMTLDTNQNDPLKLTQICQVAQDKCLGPTENISIEERIASPDPRPTQICQVAQDKCPEPTQDTSFDERIANPDPRPTLDNMEDVGKRMKQTSIKSFLVEEDTSQEKCWERMNNELLRRENFHKGESRKTRKFTDQLRHWYNESECWGIRHINKMEKVISVIQQEATGPNSQTKPPSPTLQDETAPPIMVGGDVVALYPSMEAAPTGAMAYQAVKETQVKFEKINYKFALIFLLLSIGQPAMNATGLGHLVPARKKCQE